MHKNPSKWPIMYNTVEAIYKNLQEKIQEIHEFLKTKNNRTGFWKKCG